MPIDVRSLPVGDHRKVLRQSARQTGSWRHRSATGAVLRSCVLPELSTASRASRRPVKLHIELLDPTNEVACRQYCAWAGLNSAPIAQRALEIEIYTTILAVCVERKRNRRLHPEIRFSAFFAAQQVDISDDLLMLYPAGGAGPVSTAMPGDELYQSYLSKFELSWSRAFATKLPLQAVGWSPLHDGNRIPPRNILNLYHELHLPTPEFTDGDLRAIVERLEGDEAESGDPS